MTIAQAIKGANEVLHAKGYTERTIEYTNATWKQFKAFCAERGIKNYSENIRKQYLCDALGVGEGAPKSSFTPKTAQRKAYAMDILSAYVKRGDWEKGGINKWAPLPEVFDAFLVAQDAVLARKAYSDSTRNTARKYTTQVMRFFLRLGVKNLSKITHEHIAQYLLTLNGHARSTVRGELCRLRMFLKYLYLLGYHTTDLTVHVPEYHGGQARSLPKIWESDEIGKVLTAVDRSSAKGKRDHAIILLAAELGMRSGDIRNLKFSDFDWERCSISFVQSKTGKPNALPLSEKVGAAVIDYLHARPQTESPYLFVRMIPPYDHMKQFGTIFMRYVQRAGVYVERDSHHGLHSLRASVATRLLAADVSPDVIIPFLGHVGPQTLHSYIQLDIEHLRECALSFEDGALV